MLDRLIIVLIGLQLFLRSSFFDINMLPYLNVGGQNSLGLQDILFLTLAIILPIKLFSGERKALVWNTQTKLLAIFLVLGVAGVVNASLTGTGFHLAAKEARSFFLYLLYFAVVAVRPTEKNIHKLTTIVVVLALITSVFSVVQAIVGDRIAFLFGKVMTLRISGSDIEGVTRVGSGGLASINLAFFIYFALLLVKAEKKNLIFFSVLFVGIFISFNRGTWGSIVVAIIALYPFMDRKLKVRTINKIVLLSGVTTIVFVVGLMGGMGEKLQKYSYAGVERFISFMPGHVEEDGSTLDRLTEAEIVFKKYEQRPWLGYGLGAITQKNIIRDGKAMQSWGYVHNGYLYVLFKLGAIGLLIFLLFVVLFIVRSIKGLKLILDPELKAIYLGSLSFIVSIVPHSMVSPRIMEGKYIAIISLAAGLIELIRRYSMAGVKASPDGTRNFIVVKGGNKKIMRHREVSGERELERKA